MAVIGGGVRRSRALRVSASQRRRLPWRLGVAPPDQQLCKTRIGRQSVWPPRLQRFALRRRQFRRSTRSGATNERSLWQTRDRGRPMARLRQHGTRRRHDFCSARQRSRGGSPLGWIPRLWRRVSRAWNCIGSRPRFDHDAIQRPFRFAQPRNEFSARRQFSDVKFSCAFKLCRTNLGFRQLRFAQLDAQQLSFRQHVPWQHIKNIGLDFAIQSLESRQFDMFGKR